MKSQRTLILWSVMVVVVASCSDLTMAASTPLTTVRVASGVNAPVLVTHAPGDFDRLFIVGQLGEIWILKDGVVLGTPFLNIDAIVGGTNSFNDERGILGLAFHPDYQGNGFFYVNYTNNSGNTVVRRYTVSGAEQMENTRFTKVYDVKDLAEDEQSLAKLVNAVNLARHEEKKGSGVAGFRGTLIVLASQAQHDRTERLLTMLRQSLGLELPADRHPLQGWRPGKSVDLAYIPITAEDIAYLKEHKHIES